jgi:6-pyruvoyltetrahydropterin/6-carboxytetrahydropterin synthase
MLWDEALTDEQNWEVFGKCTRLHGHTYYLDVTVLGNVDPSTGMIMNYHTLDKIMKPIVERLDHYYLNEVFDCLTTAENMVERIALMIIDEFDVRGVTNGELANVMLQETAKTTAVWDGL